MRLIRKIVMLISGILTIRIFLMSIRILLANICKNSCSMSKESGNIGIKIFV